MPETAALPDTGGSGARVVIVGGGFAGLAAAAELGGSGARVLVIDRQNHHVFQPLLYQVATASLPATDIAQPIRHVLRRFANVSVLRGEVTAIDRAARRVVMGERRIPYDRLIVATGATHNYFGRENWAANAPGLKTLGDAQRLRGRILEAFETAEAATDDARKRAALTFCIIGGGPTGVELAGAIAELARHTLAREFRAIDPAHASVLLFEAGPRLLPAFPEALSAYAARRLEGLGVTVRLETPIREIATDAVATDAGVVSTGTIVWTAGVRASRGADWLGVAADRAGRIAVDPTLRLPDDPAVLVLGDLAAAVDPASGLPLPGLAQVARQQGRYAGRSIRAEIEGRPTEPFRYRDLGSWAIVGRNVAVARIGDRSLRGRVAWLAWGAIHIGLLVGFENRFRVLLKWFWEFVTRRRGARLILP
jgi:NADH dehydrogenase